MNTLTTYLFDGQPVRTVTLDTGEPGFVGKDVADRLGYSNAADAIGKHCKGVAIRYPLPTAGGTQELRVLTEPDVLRLIVASKLPSAQRFEAWVFETVLPSIRKTGRFGTVDPMAAMNDPTWLRQTLLTYTEKVLELKPKAEALDRLAASAGSLCTRDAAAKLNVPERKLIAALITHRWAYRRSGKGSLCPMAEAMRAGVVESKTHVQRMDDGDDRLREQFRITAKGLARLSEKWLKEWGLVPRSAA